MLVISDSHVSLENQNVNDFFSLLECIEKTKEDVFFLGDIFDLWIGLKRFQHTYHIDFIYWCKHQKDKRKIYFIEGNHEFFISQAYGQHFFYSSSSHYLDKELLFVHGDLINEKDKNYLLFRKITKSWIVKALFRILPYGNNIINFVKSKAKQTNEKFRVCFPENEVINFAQKSFKNNIEVIFVGHFHQNYIYEQGNKKIIVLPDWYSTRQLMHFDTKTLKTSLLKMDDLKSF